MPTMYLVHRTDCGDGRIGSITAESFTLAPMPPLPRPPPPDPHPPPSPPPPVNGCQYTCKDNLQALETAFAPAQLTDTTVQGFCSDGGPNSVPIAHDPATGEPIFLCEFGTQCDTLECGPRTVEQVEQPICSDVCQTTISNGVSFTGASRNGICEDGGDEISHTQYVEPSSSTFIGWRDSGYLRIAGCGYGTCAQIQKQHELHSDASSLSLMV